MDFNLFSFSYAHTYTRSFFLSVTYTQDIVKESQKRRYKSVEIVDQCIEKDAQWRSVRFDLDKLNADFNKANKAVALKMKSGEKEEAEKLMPEVKRVDQLRERYRGVGEEVGAGNERVVVEDWNVVHDSVR